MAKNTSNEKRLEFRQKVAEEFINALKENGLEWKRGWKNISKLPFNDSTKKKYNGINLFYLMIKGRKYDNDPRWLTFNQILNINKKMPNDKQLSVKGQSATQIEYWFAFDKIERKSMSFYDANELIKNGERVEEDFLPTSKYYYVFNAKQILNYPELEKYKNNNIIDTEYINKLASGMGVKIINDSKYDAYYIPKYDSIYLPLVENFKTQHDYDFTAFHELSHATGHSSRLNRNLSSKFGTPDYAYEELIAEISACFMGVNLSTEIPEEHFQNHKAYIQNWISAITEKPEVLAQAIGEAQKAADYMEKIMDVSFDIDNKIIKCSEDKLKEIETYEIIKSYAEFTDRNYGWVSNDIDENMLQLISVRGEDYGIDYNVEITYDIRNKKETVIVFNNYINVKKVNDVSYDDIVYKLNNFSVENYIDSKNTFINYNDLDQLIDYKLNGSENDYNLKVNSLSYDLFFNENNFISESVYELKL